MFRNINTGNKLTILCLAFIIAIAVPIYSLLQYREKEVELLSRELVGSRYVAILREIYASVLASASNSPVPLRSTASSDDVLNALKVAEANSGGMMQTAELARSLATTLRALWSKDSARTPSGSFVLDALGVIRELASRIGEDSNLALDPIPESYYLQDIVVTKLPAILSQLGEEQTLIGEIAAVGKLSSEHHGRLLMVDGLLRSSTAELRRDLATAYRFNIDGSLKRQLDADASEMVRNVGLYFNATDEQLAGRDGKDIDANSLGAPFAAAVDSSLRLWAVAQAELDRLLTERIADMNSRMLRSIVVTGGLGIVSVILAVVMYRSIVQPLERLKHVVTQVRQTKDYGLRVRDVGQDEVGQLGVAFNDMLSELSAAHHRERRLVEANIIGIFVVDSEGRIVEANDAFLHMVGYDREDLAAGRVNRRDLTPPEWRERDARTLAEVKATGTVQPFEKEYFRKDGSRIPVLIGVTAFDEKRDQGVGFVLDLTERKRAEAEARDSERRYREVQAELAHAARVATMGQLTASIAHEVKQPITANVASAHAAQNWLDRQTPDLEEAKKALVQIVNDSIRAAEVIDRIRDLVKKAPPRKNRLEINGAIREVVELTRGEAMKNGVSVQMQLADGLPLVEGDRVQLQQVILNLIINGIQATSEASDGPRQVQISTGKPESGGVFVAVRDSGPGLAPGSLDCIFEAFHTTKPGGLGLGLSICRSIIEAHGGRLWASANVPRGAIFQFTVPAHSGSAS
jgi:PAS domain S-box-containing protein